VGFESMAKKQETQAFAWVSPLFKL